MDKKELNDLIDRVVLTGPGGTDLIKKILKKLVDGSEEGGGGSGCDCPGVMIVEGTFDEGSLFIPNSGSPSFQDAKSFIDQGGIVYLRTPDMMGIFTYSNVDGYEFMYVVSPNGDAGYWFSPKVYYGSVSVVDGVYDFTEENGASANGIINLLDGGFPVILSYELDGETIADDVVGHEASYVYTSRNVRWYVEMT